MSTEITINQDIVEINVTEEVITIEAPSGAYPLPSMVSSVFGRVGNVVAQEGDYTLTQLGGVTITSPTNNQVLKYNGTQWVNSSDTDTGLTSVGLSMPSAFSVANSPLTANGTLSVTGAGTTAQYVRGDGTLATFPTIATEAQRLITEVYNSTGATLAKGSIVYINGGQGNLPTVTKAIATGDATSAQTYGVVQSDITNMNNGFVVAMGSLTDLDTQIYPVGTQLYLSATTAGAWTSTKPYAPQHLVYVGIVVRSHPTQGVVEIRIQNGYELDELHDVSAQSPTNGDILQYVAATDLWTKAAGTTTNIAEGTRLYFTDARARAAISLTTTGTSGASTYNNTTGVLNIPQYQGVLTNPVTGTGTTNTLPKFTGASTIGNSIITESGTTITVGGTLSATTLTDGFVTISGAQINRSGGAVELQFSLGGNVRLFGSGSNPIIFNSSTGTSVFTNSVGIGTSSLAAATKLTIGGTETAVSAISRGQLINTTLVASANSDALVALDIAPTFTAGAFTGVTPYNLRISAPSTNGYSIFLTGNASINGSNQILLLRSGANVFSASSVETTVSSVGASTPLKFSLNSNATNVGQFFGTTGNFTIQNGGTFTDAGFRLDVNGTTRFIGTASSDTAPLGAELAAVTGTGTNWTLAGTNLNVGGYTHTTGSVDPLTTALAAVNGTYYQIAYTITGRTTGSITINYGGTSTSGITATGATGPLASSTAVLTITPTTDFNGTVALSIRSIGTSSASSTFAPSSGANTLEIRANIVQGNTFVGLNAGTRNTTAQFNSAFGVSALQNNTTGQFNTAISRNTLQNNTTGNQNTAIGHNSLSANTIGIGNTGLGSNALQNNTTGLNNVGIGANALFHNTTGSSNIAVGGSAGRFITGGSTALTIANNSIFIGQDTRAAADNQSNQIVIGHNTTGLGSNTTIIGTTATTTTALYGDLLLGTTTPSTATMLTVSGTETASSAIARGGLINTTLVASANNDVLVGLDIQPTFTNGAFTGVTNAALRLGGNLAFANQNFNITSNNVTRLAYNGGVGLTFSTSDSTTPIRFVVDTFNEVLRTFAATGNLHLQYGGTYTDIPTARLAVNSTTQGFLPPRMTTTQKNAISSPATGLVVFDTTLGKLCVFAGTWQTITSA